MIKNSLLVNLDAMIPREDFALTTVEASSYRNMETIGIRDLEDNSLIMPVIRKPDFQRETNHWEPEQVVSLLQSYINGDLIPSVILWKSHSYIFVIDGGHRLSAIRAWLEDDYGDGPVSTRYFGSAISKHQRKAAQKTREIVASEIGTWQHFQQQIKSPLIDSTQKHKYIITSTRGIPIQWVDGNAEKAETSFFKINTQGTALDNLEELLLENRKKPIAMAARAIIRAGMGHKYWSKFTPEVRIKIEQLSKNLHDSLFEPEVEAPLRTLDLPLGGSSGIRAALQVLIEFLLEANRNQLGLPAKISDQPDDIDGTSTINCLAAGEDLAKWLTGNKQGLGLHPAIYFYGPTGRHQTPMFLGITLLFAKKLRNNDKTFFARFTDIRAKLEDTLASNKELIATILQKTLSPKRAAQYAALLDKMINELESGQNPISEESLIAMAGLSGKIITGSAHTSSAKFSDDTKSEVFIKTALSTAMRCPICKGYLDTGKSASYDHIQEKSAGGKADAQNCQITHPYCNQSIKNKSGG